MNAANDTIPEKAGLGRLALGTAQLGMDYGIANNRGRPPDSVARSILRAAADAGICFIDTAPAYGTAESLVGTMAQEHPFRIVTKTVDFRYVTPPSAIAPTVLDGFARSRSRVGQDIYALLVHHAGSLTTVSAPYMLDALSRLKESGQVERIGVSVYDPEELERLAEFFVPEIVQAPFNIFDQRMLRSAVLKQMIESGTEFHARSAFLQGLLLCESDELPATVIDLRPYVEQTSKAASKAGLSRLEAALGFVLSHNSVSAVVVGVDRQSQLEGIVAAARHHREVADYSNIPELPAHLIDPRRWKEI